MPPKSRGAGGADVDAAGAVRFCASSAQAFALKRRLRVGLGRDRDRDCDSNGDPDGDGKARRRVTGASAVKVQVAVSNDYARRQRTLNLVRDAALPSLDAFEDKQAKWDSTVRAELGIMASELEPAKGPDSFLYDALDLRMNMLGLAVKAAKPRGPKPKRTKADDAAGTGTGAGAAETGGPASWSLLPLGLRARSISELRDVFAPLHPHCGQVGVDDVDSDFQLRHDAEAKRLLRTGYLRGMEAHLRQGCSAALRPRLYRAVLFARHAVPVPATAPTTAAEEARRAMGGGDASGSGPSSSSSSGSRKRRSGKAMRHAVEGGSLKEEEEEEEEVEEAEADESDGGLAAVVDRLHCNDLGVIRDHDSFFVFEDLLRGVLPALFTRDQHLPWLRLHCRMTPRLSVSTSASTSASNSASASTSTSIRKAPSSSSSSSRPNPTPPSSAENPVPFYGFAFLAAPLAYVFEDASDIVLCLRELYARYWCQLNFVRNGPSGAEGRLLPLPNLCCQFEALVQRRCPAMVRHMGREGVAPLDVALPWLHLAFAQALAPEQVLLLWDRVVGFDSLLVLPLLAAAMFAYREPAVLKLRSPRRIRDVLRETTKYNVGALLQAFLFCEGKSVPVPHHAR